jgi:hypothetical protein
MPAHKVAKTPETRLGGEKEPKKNPIIPPKNADNAPMYGPKIMPIIGAIIAAAVIACPDNPIIGEIFKKPKTTYNAVKQTIKPTSLAISFLPFFMLGTSSVTKTLVSELIDDIHLFSCLVYE